MAKIRIEICMISARGLRRSSPLLKPHWFAVGWIDSNDKYCTKIDTSGSSPTWKTKFSVLIDDTSRNLQGLTLTVEVYRRDPVFLRERLQGTATVMLKEFLVKFVQDRDALGSGIEESGSYQLRKPNSSKHQGLVDISVGIAEEMEGMNEGFHSTNDKNVMSLAIEDGPVVTYPRKPQPPVIGHQFSAYNQSSYPNSHPPQMPINSLNPLPSGPEYHRGPTPPPPPPPSNAGFLPTLFPGTSRMPETYVNLPPSGNRAQHTTPGFGMGLGAGALAAGAVIFGDDFMSGSSFPSSLEGSSLVISTDPPF